MTTGTRAGDALEREYEGRVSLHHPTGPEGKYVWVYLWGWPLRLVHWAGALSVVTLVVTGLYIGRPYFVTGGEASSHFLMGWVRLTHFIAAGVIVASLFLRIYWLFAGNRYERWQALFPFSRANRRNMWRALKAYVLIRPKEFPAYLGHNPLQQIFVTGVYGALLVMMVTGFAMYGQSAPGGFFYSTFNWVNSLLGGQQVVRFVHHVVTWLIVTFIPLHVYLAIRHEMMDHGAVVSSIISGGRFVREDEQFEDA